MKLIHISDLHLGKKVNEISMLDEQEHILNEIAEIAEGEKPCVMVIAGDIYDKPVPPAEAVRLFDSFLVRISEAEIPVFAISGNHDSPERIAFGSKLMKRSGVYLSPVYDGVTEPVTIEDEYGKVNFYMLPFVKPSSVRRFFSDENIESYDDAVRAAVKAMNIDTGERNVMIAHQFVTGAERCDSESVSVGGVDDVGADIFADFDYAALGHIHGAQRVGTETVRYCGTPLKYSFSEVNHKKSVTVAELKEKGSTEIRTVPLTPINEMREIKGSYMEVTSRGFYTEENRNDYVRVILTDEQDIPEGIGKLRAVYPNIMALEYDNKRTRAEYRDIELTNEKIKTPTELFSEFYEQRNNAPMSAEQQEYISELIEKLWDNE